MNKIIILKQTVILKQDERKMVLSELERELAMGYLVVPPGFVLVESDENTRIGFDTRGTEDDIV